MNMTLSPLHKAKGVVLVLVALSLLVLMGVAGLAIDLSHAEVNKTRLQNLADSLALSAAISLNKNESSLAAETYATNNTYPTFRNSTGNQEVKAQLGNLTINYSFAVDQPGPYVASSSTDFTRHFARVVVTNMTIGTWFARVIGFNNMAVSTSAVAGTVNIAPCDLAPFAMCAGVDASGNVKDPNCENATNTTLGNDCYGYVLNALYCMKDQSGSNDQVLCPAPLPPLPPTLGPGNFGFLNLGNTSPSLEICAAGDPSCSLNCVFPTSIPTKTGQNVGPVSDGFNTRFNIYSGNIKNVNNVTTLYPPDKVTGGTVVTGNGNNQTYVTDTTPVTQPHAANPELNNGLVDKQGNPITGFVNFVQTVGSETALNTAYSSYLNAYSPNTVAGVSAATIDVPGGIKDRRILTVPFVNCNVSLNGKSDAPIVGYGCFFMAREYSNVSVPYVYGSSSASKPYLYGEFVGTGCNGIGKINSVSNNGVQKVILYKDPFGGHS